jgi:hypothetical protein
MLDRTHGFPPSLSSTSKKVGAPTFKVLLEGFPETEIGSNALRFYRFLPHLPHANIAMHPHLWYLI